MSGQPSEEQTLCVFHLYTDRKTVHTSSLVVLQLGPSHRGGVHLQRDLRVTCETRLSGNSFQQRSDGRGMSQARCAATKIHRGDAARRQQH